MDAQVLHPQLLTLAVMASGAWLTLALGLGGNAVALITLASQVRVRAFHAAVRVALWGWRTTSWSVVMRLVPSMMLLKMHQPHLHQPRRLVRCNSFI